MQLLGLNWVLFETWRVVAITKRGVKLVHVHDSKLTQSATLKEIERLCLIIAGKKKGKVLKVWTNPLDKTA